MIRVFALQPQGCRFNSLRQPGLMENRPQIYYYYYNAHGFEKDFRIIKIIKINYLLYFTEKLCRLKIFYQILSE